ncbi:3-keto-disaccharide hydrolase [Planctomicrobium sp. SH668]|uniref:3-keto-disaccharide hydrolase n=1 Tax=Planctomicrobium sp. SH668 TaxID=3448126 RepID=UPI003F5BCCAD
MPVSVEKQGGIGASRVHSVVRFQRSGIVRNAVYMVMALALFFFSRQLVAQVLAPIRNASYAGEVSSQALIQRSFPGNEWTFVSAKKGGTLEDTWEIRAEPGDVFPILVCRGQPHGYLKTNTKYQNFHLSVEWRFPKDPDGNSGILLFTGDEERLWPKSVQVQLHQPEVGATFPVGGAKTANRIRGLHRLAKPVNQWNRCEVECRNGLVSVTVNGHRLGTITDCMPSNGAIGLQSEGYEVHFRNLSIREIPEVSSPAVANSEVTTDSDR